MDPNHEDASWKATSALRVVMERPNEYYTTMLLSFTCKYLRLTHAEVAEYIYFHVGQSPERLARYVSERPLARCLIVKSGEMTARQASAFLDGCPLLNCVHGTIRFDAAVVLGTRIPTINARLEYGTDYRSEVRGDKCISLDLNVCNLSFSLMKEALEYFPNVRSLRLSWLGVMPHNTLCESINDSVVTLELDGTVSSFCEASRPTRVKWLTVSSGKHRWMASSLGGSFPVLERLNARCTIDLVNDVPDTLREAVCPYLPLGMYDSVEKLTTTIRSMEELVLVANCVPNARDIVVDQERRADPVCVSAFVLDELFRNIQSVKWMRGAIIFTESNLRRASLGDGVLSILTSRSRLKTLDVDHGNLVVESDNYCLEELSTQTYIGPSSLSMLKGLKVFRAGMSASCDVLDELCFTRGFEKLSDVLELRPDLPLCEHEILGIRASLGDSRIVFEVDMADSSVVKCEIQKPCT